MLDVLPVQWKAVGGHPLVRTSQLPAHCPRTAIVPEKATGKVMLYVAEHTFIISKGHPSNNVDDGW
jgi:hypothetical protein